MKSSDSSATFSRPHNDCAIQTQTVRVSVTTDDYEIEGFIHVKPGGYQSRVSDLLNVKDLHFIPMTQVTYQSLRHPDEPPRTSDTLIVRLDTIKMVIPQNCLDKVVKEPGEQKLSEEPKKTENWQS
jgi:hypothetical protein